MASIRVEQKALTDPRFKILGIKMGTSRFDARARVEELWAYCTEHKTYFIEEDVIDALTEWNGFSKLILDPQVALAEQTERGIRIKGTKGRIEWLAKLRKQSQKGGNKTKAKWQANRLAKRGPNEGPNEGPLTLTPTLTLNTNTTTLVVEVEEFVKTWNENCGDLPGCKALSEKRRKSIKQRLSENSDLTYWAAIVRWLASSGWHTGGNDRGWKANIDFLLQPDRHFKIAEMIEDSKIKFVNRIKTEEELLAEIRENRKAAGVEHAG